MQLLMNAKKMSHYKLKEGDTVAILAPSSGVATDFPHVYEEGLRNLKEVFNLKVKIYPTARMSSQYLHAHPELRAKDVNDAFADPAVRGIITTIGGDDSIRILPFLDEKIIKNNPKIFMGYSDATVLLVYLNMLGLISFHGPSVMAGFAQTKYLPLSFQSYIHSFLFGDTKNFLYEAFESYSDGYEDWSIKAKKGCPKKLQKNDGWQWINGTATTSGALFGGCIEALEFLKGTKYWPAESFWDNKILFLETSEEKPTVDQVKYMLRNYGVQGVFQRISALFFGRANFYSKAEKKALEKVILGVVVGEFGAKEIPIVTNMDFGHTDPQFILPLGVEIEVSPLKKTIRLMAKA